MFCFTFLIVVHVVDVDVPATNVRGGQVIAIHCGTACLPVDVVTALVLVAHIHCNTQHSHNLVVG